jgi:hypothetical protein
MPKRKQEPEEQHSDRCRVECQTILDCIRKAQCEKRMPQLLAAIFPQNFISIQLLKSEEIFAFLDGE